MKLREIKQNAILKAGPFIAFVQGQLLAPPARKPGFLAAASRGPLVVAGLFRTASGIGESARRCADALEAQGFTVHRCDLSDAFMQTDLPPDQRLRSFPADRSGTLILHLNAPETVKGLLSLGYRGKKHWRVIGYWVWEFETLPRSWRAGARHLSEIWTPSQFSADAIIAAVDLPVAVAPHYVSPPALSAGRQFREDAPDDAVVTLIMGDSRSSHDRKNLLGGVKAFLKGVGDNPKCRLVIKTRNFEGQTAFNDALAALIQSHPRIRVIDQSLSDEKKWALLEACDIFLSLHRSEGFGLVIAEAMALGKAVIATAWSGNMEFMTPQSAFLTRYKLIPVQDQAGVYDNIESRQRWADPDLEVAAKALQKLSEDSALRRTMGARAAEEIKSRLNGIQYKRCLQNTGGQV